MICKTTHDLVYSSFEFNKGAKGSESKLDLNVKKFDKDFDQDDVEDEVEELSTLSKEEVETPKHICFYVQNLFYK